MFKILHEIASNLHQLHVKCTQSYKTPPLGSAPLSCYSQRVQRRMKVLLDSGASCSAPLLPSKATPRFIIS